MKRANRCNISWWNFHFFLCERKQWNNQKSFWHSTACDKRIWIELVMFRERKYIAERTLCATCESFMNWRWERARAHSMNRAEPEFQGGQYHRIKCYSFRMLKNFWQTIENWAGKCNQERKSKRAKIEGKIFGSKGKSERKKLFDIL